MSVQVSVPHASATPTCAGGLSAMLLRLGADKLLEDDPELAVLIEAETTAASDTLAMVAHASLAHPSVLAAAGSVLSNVTAEGYPGRRFHPGSQRFDAVERLAVERAKAAFGARYANVQPHSCSAANSAVLFGLLEVGDTLLGLALDAGGHLTHGARASVTGRVFNAIPYALDPADRIDYAQVETLARRHRPKMIIAGASAYPRAIDYPRLRAIADAVGAYLLADISHIAGLVAGGVLPNPVDVAHVTTTSTYKQLGGPRGGLILMGADFDRPGPDGSADLPRLLDRAVFPHTQGTPNASAIAAKARALDLVGRPEFARTARLIADDAAALAAGLAARGFQVLTGGTDNHMVVVDMSAFGLTGYVAERALEECGIYANRNRIPGDREPPQIASGLRFGTNILAQRGMKPEQMEQCARLVADVMAGVVPTGRTAYTLDADVRAWARSEVAQLCRQFPAPSYPVPEGQAGR